MDIDKSSTLSDYKKTMLQCLQMYIPNVSVDDLNEAIDYSINKRYKNTRVRLSNSYTKKNYWNTLLAWSDYIDSRQPITNAFGTMFKKHADCPNPMSFVIQEFLAQRAKYKAEMFKYPRGSEDFEKYNLSQSLEKINGNGCYGTLGAATSLLYNVNVATSVTSAGRTYISTASLLFEAFLANNVQFGSLDEVLEFINHIIKEKPNRKYKDEEILNHYITTGECFAKIVLECGFRWIPNENELDIIWMVINNLSQQDLNRVYYKNNLYEFCLNTKVSDLIVKMLQELKSPYFVSLKPPKEIIDDLNDFTYLLKEFVYYRYMYIDRIVRCDNMIKKVIAVSDTDSCILTLDPWYRFVLKLIDGKELGISRIDPLNAVYFIDKDEFGDVIDKSQISPVYFEEPEEDYDFTNDEIVEVKKLTNPIVWLKSDYVKYSIINIMAYILDRLMNDYMLKVTENQHSRADTRKCCMYMKTEFVMTRLLITAAKKNYASLMTMQEGKMIPEDEQLDVKGIECLTKSGTAASTRKALKKILLEDIFMSPTIDQWKIVKDLAIFEKKIINSIRSGDRKYYKPATIKALGSYADPMRIQGVKGATVWNAIRDRDLPAIDLEERNAVSIAKVIIDKGSIEKIKDSYPYQYDQALKLLDLTTDEEVTDKKTGQKKIRKKKVYNDRIESISLPLDIKTPGWVLDLIDYNTIVNDNMGGFPYQSAGIVKLNKNTNFSNILQL